MTKFLTTKTVRKSLLAVLMLILCLSLTMAIACGTTNEPSEESFTKTETDELTITNGNFEFGTAEATKGDFPYSANGWSLSSDDSAATSYVSSGIIDVADWDSLSKTLYDDSDFKNYILEKYFDGDSNTSEDDVKAKIKEVYQTTSAPTADAKDHKVYMLNNYQQFTSSTNFFGLGTAQKLTSSTTINLVDGQYGKFTIWIKTTNNLASTNSEYGANIRLKNTISGVTQDEYQISNINTNGEWKEYVIYVQATDFSDTSLTVILGLGYGNGKAARTDNYCEGTVYFDEIDFEQFDSYAEYVADLTANDLKIDGDGEGSQVLTNTAITPATFTSTDSVEGIQVTPEYLEYTYESTDYKYFCSYFNMTLKYYLSRPGATQYFENISANTDYTLTHNVTISNADEGASIRGDRFSPDGATNTLTVENPNTEDEALVVSVSKASYNFTIKSDKFAVNYGEYVQISFYLKTDLLSYDRSGLTVYAYDVEGDTFNPDGKDHSSVLLDSIKTSEDDNENGVLYSLIFKNNFPNSAKKSFYLTFYVGPVNVASQNDPTYYPTGTVTISDLKISTSSTAKKVLGVTNPNFDIFYLFNSISDEKIATCSLYSGYSADYDAPSSTESYTFAPSNEDLGTITTGLSNVYQHTGVNSNSKYINVANTDYTTDDTSVNGDDVTYAGVFNTKYIADNITKTESDYYTLNEYAKTQGYTGIGNAIDWNECDTNKQPLVILNKTNANYGYFTQTKTIDKSSSITFSVKVKVIGDATAYIYIIDMTDDSTNKLSVMALKSPTEGATTHNLMTTITKADCTEDGWLTVNFYIATGDNAKSYRIEFWNGARDGQNNSNGMVIFDEYSFGESFTEGDVFNADSPLNTAYTTGKITYSDVERYTRALTQAEIDFNNSSERVTKGYSEVEYENSPIYASDNKSLIYAIYNTIEPTEVDPWEQYAEEEEEDTEEESCVNWSNEAFWLNLASIILAVVLLVAIIIVIVRTFRTRKLNASKEVREHYSVKSRNSVHNQNKKKAEDAKLANDSYENAETDTVTAMATASTITEEDIKAEQGDTERTFEENKEEFVYGDVLEDFSDTPTEEKVEEPKEVSVEQPAEEVEKTAEVTPTEEKVEETKAEENADKKDE